MSVMLWLRSVVVWRLPLTCPQPALPCLPYKLCQGRVAALDGRSGGSAAMQRQNRQQIIVLFEVGRWRPKQLHIACRPVAYGLQGEC